MTPLDPFAVQTAILTRSAHSGYLVADQVLLNASDDMINTTRVRFLKNRWPMRLELGVSDDAHSGDCTSYQVHHSVAP